MAGYYIYSLDWEEFRHFVEEPADSRVMAFAEQISDALDDCDDEFDEGDPMQDWPVDPKDLVDVARQRLALPDWYGDLSDVGKPVIERSITRACDESLRQELGFRVESDGIYWTAIEIAQSHHGIQPDTFTKEVLSQFGTRPYRYHPEPGYKPNWDDWHAMHSMHSPDEVQRLLEELTAAESASEASDDAHARQEYESELMPSVEKVARESRLLYIAVDT